MYNGSYFYFSFFVCGLRKTKRILRYPFPIFYYEIEKRKTKGRYIHGPFLHCLMIFFCKVSDIHDHNTRKSSSQHLYMNFHNTTRGQKMFSYCGATIWNFILNEIDPNCSIGKVKKQIRHIFLFSSEDVLKKMAYKFATIIKNTLCTMIWKQVIHIV